MRFGVSVAVGVCGSSFVADEDEDDDAYETPLLVLTYLI